MNTEPQSKFTVFNDINWIAAGLMTGADSVSAVLGTAVTVIRNIKSESEITGFNQRTRMDGANNGVFLGTEASKLLDIYKKFDNRFIKGLAFEAFRGILDIVPPKLPDHKDRDGWFSVRSDLIDCDYTDKITYSASVYMNMPELRAQVAEIMRADLDEAPLRPAPKNGFGVSEPCHRVAQPS